MKDKNITAFHKVTWSEKDQIVLIGPALQERTRHGLWIVDCKGGAVLVWNDTYHGKFVATPEGAEELRKFLVYMTHPALRDVYKAQWKKAGKAQVQCASLSGSKSCAIGTRIDHGNQHIGVEGIARKQIGNE